MDSNGPTQPWGAMEETINQLKVMHITPVLRYRVPFGTSTNVPVLEQAWQNINTGEIEWRPVPTEVANG